MYQSSVLFNLMAALPTIPDHHAPGTPLYELLKKMARGEVSGLFGLKQDRQGAELGPFRKIILPYRQMGSTDTTNLFDLDELIIFAFYWANRGRYHRVMDLGANVGLHSIVLDRCGYDVRAFEPDPQHYKSLVRNMRLNRCRHYHTFQNAVGAESGEREFVRVIGNTMSSHLAGCKQPYGELERFPVPVEAFGPLLPWANLVKMDVEGAEAEILLSTTAEDWQGTDALIEIQSPENAALVFGHFKWPKVRLFSQKTNWREVRSLEDMPTSYHEGTLFLTCKEVMPW
ncbi:MAG: FkbM family methyltransferase [Candidatus Omnitrophota bacterium]